MAKRKSPIAKSLVSNSISGMFSAIEIHNKPMIRYRYETVVLLVLNAWELLLKAYIYKFHKKIKLFYKDGTTKTFDNCLNLVNQEVGKDFHPTNENLGVLYQYRNQAAHFYIEELDPIVFSLISKNILFYSRFLKDHFKVDITRDSDLILLPIGFKRPTSPVDYISSQSVNDKASAEVKEFLGALVDSTKKLNDEGIEESIFVDFRINLINVNKITNADLIAGIDNTKANEVTFSVNKDSKKVVVVAKSGGEKLSVTRNRSEAQGTLYYEELQEGIFDEINNLLDANRLLAKGKSRFMLGAALYYRIYSERQYVNFTIDTFEMLARNGAIDLYGPFMYWLTKLPPSNIAKILIDIFKQSKSPNIHNLVKISILLGPEASKTFFEAMDAKYKNMTQKPDFLYSYQEQLKRKTVNPILKALKSSNGKILLDNRKYDDFLKDTSLAINTLSKECLDVFNGDTTKRTIIRELDYLAYGPLLTNNPQVVEQIKVSL